MTLVPLLSSEQIHRRVLELADTIEGLLKDGCDPLLIGILNGSIHFLSDLSRAIATPHAIDMLRVTSYKGAESTGAVRILKDLDSNIEGRDVFLVEDIVDTGATLSHLREWLECKRPRSLRVVTLLSKIEARTIGVPIEFTGFEIPNVFVVGYGLDYEERYRNLPFIAMLHEE